MDPLTRDALRYLWWPTEDTKDFRSRPTYWIISKQLHVSPKIVKARLDSLRNDGVLKGVMVRPDVSLFGLRKSALLVSFGNNTRLTLEQKVSLLDFVECVYVGRVYHMQEGRIKIPSTISSTYVAEIDLIHRPEENLERKTELLRSLVGDFTVASTIHAQARNVQAQVLSKNRLIILRELTKKPLAEMKELSRAASVDEKTAARYLSELARARAFLYAPVFDARRSKEFLFHLGLVTEPGRRKLLVDKLKEVMPEKWLGVSLSENFIRMTCVAEDLGDANDLFFKLSEDEDLKESIIVFGLYTIDNSTNTGYVPSV